MHVQHVYREANGCADDLAKQGTRQRNLVSFIVTILVLLMYHMLGT